MSRFYNVTLNLTGYSSAMLQADVDRVAQTSRKADTQARSDVPIAQAPNCNGLRVLVKYVRAEGAGGQALLAINGHVNSGVPSNVPLAAAIFVLDENDPPTEFFLEPGEKLVGAATVPGCQVCVAESKWFGYAAPSNYGPGR